MKEIVQKHRDQGQIFVFAIVILVILLIATLFLFDLHSIIRAKIKLDTAEQSAALAAAKWQARSLNLIGEINFVKAAETLLDDIPTIGDDDSEKIASASRTLTEMQSRISFCGPLIAFGAAQQAAKNNGIDIDSQGSRKTVYSDLNNYLNKLDPASEYYNYWDIDEYINYYKWRDPYVAMLKLIRDQGLAVRPNGRFPGIESIDPPWLDSETLYSAIQNKTWCNPTLNSIIKYPDSYWNGKWWNVDFDHTSFPNESEIYTLGVKFTRSLDADTLEDALATINSASTEDLEPIRWCVYENRWFQYKAGMKNKGYDGPNSDGLNYWSRGMFLRDNLKKSVLYGGATAYAECYQHIKLMNKYRHRMTTPYRKGHPYAGADQMEKAKVALQNDIIRKTSSKSLKVGNDSATDASSGGAVAKPLGALPDGSPPTDAIIVLPLFNNVSLIPSSMQRCRPLRVDFSDLERFLIWLSSVDNLHNPSTAPPDGTQKYLTALQTLDDPAFRKIGWNNDYVYDGSNVAIFFGDAYKYDPAINPNGSGWLQQIWMNTDFALDEDSDTKIREEEAGWNTRIYSGRNYILRDQNGNLVTCEQMECRWPPGGYGPGPGPGTTIGPSTL